MRTSLKLRVLAMNLLIMMVRELVPSFAIHQLNSKDSERYDSLEIINEVVSLREDAVTHFLMSDGSYLAVQYTPSAQYISSETDERGNKTEYTYNENKDAKGNIIRYLFNEIGYNQVIYSDKNKNVLRDSFETFVKYDNSNIRLSSIDTGISQFNFTNLPDDSLSKTQVGNRNLKPSEYFESIGNPYSILYGNGNYIDYQYDSLNRVSRQTYISSQSTRYYTFKYDNQDNMTEYNDSKGNVTVKYNYDFEDRLVGCKGSSGKTVYQGFDSKERINGLLHKWKNSSKQYSYTYNNGELGQLVCRNSYDTNVISYQYVDATWGDLLTKYNEMNITNDAIGNPLTDRNGINLTWTNVRPLYSFDNSSYNITSKYNIVGLRTNKTVYNKSTQTYTVYECFYQDGLLLSQKVITTGEQTIEYWFIYDVTGSVLGFTIGNIVPTGYWYISLSTKGKIFAAKYTLLLVKLGAFLAPVVQMVIILVGVVLGLPSISDFVGALLNCLWQKKKRIEFTLKRLVLECHTPLTSMLKSMKGGIESCHKSICISGLLSQYLYRTFVEYLTICTL